MDVEKVFINLGKEIRKKRIDKDLSRQSLAEKSGLSLAYIGCLERGERNPTVKTLVHLMEGLEEGSFLIEGR